MSKLSNNKYRQLLLKLHGHKYERHFTTEGYYCFYCGDPADCLDHVPPLSMMEFLTTEKIKRERIPRALVPCCAECNRALGSRQLLTVFDRLLYLESYYEAYFKEQRAMWSEDEIEELGHSLQSMVRARQEKLGRYIDKIRNIQVRQIKTETYPMFNEVNEEKED